MPEQITDQEKEQEQHLLDQLSISTVGLVSRGAVSVIDDEETGEPSGENFILLKGDGPMPDKDTIDIEEVSEQEAQPDTEPTTEAVTETPPDEELTEDQQEEITTLVDRIRSFFKSQPEEAEKADPAALRAAAQTLRDGGYEVTAQDLARRLADTVTDDEVEAGAKPTQKAAPEENMDNTQLSAIEAVHKAHTETLLTAIKDEHERNLLAVTKAVEQQYEGKINDLQTRVEKAEVDKQAETDSRIKQELLEKATAFRMLPVPKTELADQLFDLKKHLTPENYDWWEATVKAVDAQLGMAGIFGEHGTSRTVEEITLTEKVEKAAKEQDISFDEALLTLPEHEQAIMLEEWRS